MHPILKTLVHHVRFQHIWAVCRIIEIPKRTQKAIPAPSDGTYPYEVPTPGILAWQPTSNSCLSMIGSENSHETRAGRKINREKEKIYAQA